MNGIFFMNNAGMLLNETKETGNYCSICKEAGFLF